MVERKKWSKHQNGFMKDHRTEDNLFIMNTLLNGVKRKKDQAYMCYVDFAKFFDTINRDHLYYKLISNGIGGNIINIIKSMYDSGHYTVKIENELFGKVDSRTGVKQGCCMSPLLSNIFQNDLHEIFDQECMPLKLNNKTINSLSWADDLVLISTSPAGLQRCLDKLLDYCYKWGLSVNSGKTKCMIVNDNRRNISSTSHFYYNTKELELVRSYTYLGFCMHKSNNLKYVVEDRIKKATRMIYPIKQLSLAGNYINIPVAMSVFDKQVTPMLLYGAAVWSLPTKKNLCYINGVKETTEKTRNLANKLITDVLKRPSEVITARRVGKRDRTHPRNFLVELKKTEEKYQLLHTKDATFTSFETKTVNNKIESMVNKFYKFLMGQSKFASNTACMGELGRYPIYIKAWTLAVKYWLRLEKGTKNVLLNDAYKEKKHQKYWWYINVEKILKENGFQYASEKSQGLHIKSFCAQFEQRLKDQHMQKWHARMTESKNITHAIKVDYIYNKAHYLDNLASNHIKNVVSKLRIGHNNLGYSIKNAQKSCPKCPQTVETLEHTLLHCKEYEEGRKVFIEKLSKQNYYGEFMANNDRTKVINMLELHPQCYIWKSKKDICTYLKYVDDIRKI